MLKNKINTLKLILFMATFISIFWASPSIDLFAEEPTTPETTTEIEAPTLTDNRLQPPLKILLIGDSLVEWGFGNQFESKVSAYNGITVVRKFKNSSGLNRTDYFDWYSYTKELVSAEKPDVLVIFMGANDGQNIRADDGNAYTMDNVVNWDNTYRKRVSRFLEENHESIKYIFWIGHPIPRTSDFHNKFVRMNPIYESECALYSNCIYVNSWDRFAINGSFVSRLADNNGTVAEVKSSDGVHLTSHGGNILTDLIIDYLNIKINLGEPRPIKLYPQDQPTEIILMSSISESNIPALFKQIGSQTTDLSNLTLENSKSVQEFTIDIPDIGTIKFKDPIDLSSRELKYLFNDLDKYVKIEKGKVSIDTEFLPQLNKPASITIRNLELLTTPVILKNGNMIKDEVTNLKFENNTLSFDVNEFSTYTIKPKLIIKTPPKETAKEVIEINGRTSDLLTNIKVYLPYNIVTEITEFDEKGNFRFEVPLMGKDNSYKVISTFFNGYQEETIINIRKVEDISLDQTQKYVKFTNNLIIPAIFFFLSTLVLDVFLIKKHLRK